MRVFSAPLYTKPDREALQQILAGMSGQCVVVFGTNWMNISKDTCMHSSVEKDIPETQVSGTTSVVAAVA